LPYFSYLNLKYVRRFIVLSCLCPHFIFSLLKGVEEAERSRKLYHHCSYYIKPARRFVSPFPLSATVAYSQLSICLFFITASFKKQIIIYSRGSRSPSLIYQFIRNLANSIYQRYFLYLIKEAQTGKTA
jgi:hypothetical protein